MVDPSPSAPVSFGSLPHPIPVHNAIPQRHSTGRPRFAASEDGANGDKSYAFPDFPAHGLPGTRYSTERKPRPANGARALADQSITQENHPTGLAEIALSRQLFHHSRAENPLARAVRLDIIPKIQASWPWEFGRFLAVVNRVRRPTERLRPFSVAIGMHGDHDLSA